MKENFHNLVKEIDMLVQEAWRVPIMMDAKRPTPKHIIIKRPKVKDKERLFKTRENKLVIKRFPWEGCGEMDEEVKGVRSTNRWLQNIHGDVKYNIGNGVAKEPMHDPWT